MRKSIYFSRMLLNAIHYVGTQTRKHVKDGGIVLCMMLFAITSLFAQDPSQYGTPFADVPDTRDVNMYQVHIRPFSAAGNLAGVTARLDNIKALGINVVYLMPIYPHGTDSRSSASPYCIKDFKAVGSEYGSLSDLRTLVDGAHSRGMAVILDVAINGTSWDNAWTTQHPEYYLRSGTTIQQLGNFSDIAALDLNSSATRAAIKDALRYWILAANVDGFRCDYANNPPLDFWSEVIGNIRGINTHKLLMLAEGDRQANFTAGFDINFGDRWFYNALKDVAGGGPVSQRFQTINDYEYLNATGGNQACRYTGNHDTYTNDNGSSRPFAVFQNHNGIVANFLVSAYLKGVPFLMSGQEIDYEPKTDWPWTNFKFNWSQNPTATADFAKILNFRTTSTAIRRGTLTMYTSDDISAFTKTSGSEKVVVMANLRNASKTFVIPSGMSGTYKDAYNNNNVTLTSGATQSFGAYQYIVLTNTNVPVVAVTSVSVSPTSATVGIGSTQQLNATISPSNATNQNVTWTSSNMAVANVNSGGLVSGIAAGTATITVKTTDGNKTATSAITVAAIPVTGVSVSPTTASLFMGATQQLSATVSPANATNKNVTWSSSNASVATVNAAGLVTAIAAGSANITVTTQSDGKTAVAAITVKTTTSFTVNFFKPSTWGTVIRIYWWSAQPAGVLADGSWPGVTMTNAGNGWYSYTFTNVTSTNLIFNDGSNQTADLNRNKNGWYQNNTWYDSNPGGVVLVTGVTVSPASASIAVNATTQLSATVAPSNAANITVSWSSNNTTVATVNSSGLVTGKAAGTATITVTTQDGNKTATSAITVTSSGGTGTGYYIINRWQNTYLYDNNQVVKYSSSPSGTSYQWVLEDVDGYKRIKNVGTGRYMNVENLLGYVQSTSIAADAWSAQWALESYSGYTRIRNRWQGGSYVHVESLNGNAQYGSVDASFYSGHWTLQSLSGARLAQPERESVIEQKNNGFSMYPNPVKDGVLIITLPANTKAVQIGMMDAIGKLMSPQAERLEDRIKIDVRGFNRGMYIVTLKSDAGVYKQKVLIE